jgi:hypothetical protein
MVPQINVSESTLSLLKELADPFVDTSPEAVILKALKSYKTEKTSTASEVFPWTTAQVKTDDNTQMVYAADAAPDLKFTRPIEITLDGEKLGKNLQFWNALLFEIVNRAATKLPADKLRQAILVNFVEGQNDENGYRFIPNAKLSVQGQASNAAWKAIIHLVKSTGMKIDVVFLWETKDKAANPGKTGRMVWESV